MLLVNSSNGPTGPGGSGGGRSDDQSHNSRKVFNHYKTQVYQALFNTAQPGV